VLALGVLAIAPARCTTSTAQEVSFAREVLPVFREYCIRCHGSPGFGIGPVATAEALGSEPAGGLRLTSYEELLRGGVSGSAVHPGRPAESLLLRQLETGVMPPDGPRVPPEAIRRIRDWIAAGAPDN
jgi:mono/diheme cytochrome c family protein